MRLKINVQRVEQQLEKQRQKLAYRETKTNAQTGKDRHTYGQFRVRLSIVMLAMISDFSWVHLQIISASPISLSVPISIPLCLSVSRLSLYIFISIYMYIAVSAFLCISLFFCIILCVLHPECISVLVCLPVWLSRSLFHA